MQIDRTNIEIEMKCYISESEYDNLIRHLNLKDKISLQTNYYFDTNNHDLINNKTVLRIRQKGEQYKLTAKLPSDDGVKELHKFLTKDEALNMIDNGFDGNIIGIRHHVLFITKLDTYRASIPYFSGKLFVDKSIYGHKTDYEIEFEVEDLDQGKADFKKILNEFNLTLTPTKSKAKRAYEEAKRNG